MLIGARTAAWSGGGAWVNPYVTDGLVAMWDGEWNKEGGVHDATYDGCFDLSGNGHHMTFVGTHTIGPNYVAISGTSNAYGIINNMTFGVPSTQELVTKISSCNNYGRFVGEGRGLCVYNPVGNVFGIGYLYGFGNDGNVDHGTDVYFEQLFSQSLTVSDKFTMYSDGEFRSQKMNSNTSTYSGYTTFFNRYTGGRGITGNLYNVRFYNRALSAQEIAENFAVDQARFGIT